MDSYEVQANVKDGWQIVAVFDGYDRAYECAVQLDRDRVYDDLRVTREIEDRRTGRFRATTVYRCGQKVRDEIAREEEEAARMAAMEKRQHRLSRSMMRRWTCRPSGVHFRLDGEAGPIRIAFWTTVLFSAGMGAVYYFEFVVPGLG